MSEILGKEQILAARDQVVERLEVPEWGGAVYIRSISAKERGVIEAAAARWKESKGRDDSFVKTFTLHMAGMALCDADGNRLFSDQEIAQLADRNAAAIAHVAEAAQRLAGLTKEDIQALEKNSGEAQPDDSPSA
jgi:hypothetical protein